MFIFACNSIPNTDISIRSTGPHLAIYFITRALACYQELSSVFYVNNIKVIPANIYELITIKGLGDGSWNSGIRLNFQAFSVQDNVRLINVLIIKFDLECTLHINRGKPVIYISAKSFNRIREQLRPPMVPSMYYTNVTP